MFLYTSLYGAMTSSTWSLNFRHLCMNYQIRHLPSGNCSLWRLLIAWGFSTVASQSSFYDLVVNCQLFNLGNSAAWQSTTSWMSVFKCGIHPFSITLWVKILCSIFHPAGWQTLEVTCCFKPQQGCWQQDARWCTHITLGFWHLIIY